MTDNDKAIQEAERIAAADEYFKCRTWLMDTNDNRRIFEAGFDRAYALPSKLRAPVADEAQEPVGELFRHGEGRDENGPRVGIRMLPAAAGLPHGTQVYAAPQASEAVRDVEDAERWRWATASDGNADKLCSIVLCHGGYQDKINERADFYRAALSAQPGAQRTGGSE